MTADTLIRGLREQIVERLRGEILSGRLEEGTPLREVELSKRFGVSRGPIREALQQLTHEGMLVSLRNCGARVASDPPDSIRELVTPIRETLEVFALRLFVNDLREEDFAAWEEILARLKAACEKRDYAAIAEQDMALHRSLLQRAGQEDLLAIWSVLVARVRSHFRANNPRPADPLEIYAEHRELIDTVRRGDAEASVKSLAEHITSTAPLRSQSQRSGKRDKNR